MIKYRVVPEGSKKWLPRDWEKWYKQFRQAEEELPDLWSRYMHKALEYARRIILTKYLTKSKGGITTGGIKFGKNPGALGVVTGRLRSSIAYKIERVSRDKIEGLIGTNVWYGRWWEGIDRSTRIAIGGYTRRVPKKPWLEPGIKSSEDWISRLFAKVGMRFQRVGK